MADIDETLPFDPIDEARRQWATHGFSDTTEALGAVTSIMRAQQILLKRMTQALEPFPLSFARYEALVVLWFSRRGEMPLGKLGARLQVHPASVTNVVDRLEADGFVTRTVHPDDGRLVLAKIAPAGRRIVKQATAALNEQVYRTLELDEQKLGTLFELLREIRAGAGDFLVH
jgi:DNA-binding MarR family transcriptional regulator